MSETRIREMLRIKDETGGWADPGQGRTGDRGCLVVNLQAAHGTTACPGYLDDRAEIVGQAIYQYPDETFFPSGVGLMEMHSRLSPGELDRICEKAMIARESEI